MSADLKDKKESAKEKVQDEYSYQPRKRSAASKKAKKDNAVKETKNIKTPNPDNSLLKVLTSKAFLISVGLLVILVAAFLMTSLTLPKTKIAKNVYINGIDVGLMTKEDAIEKLSGILVKDEVFEVTSSAKSSKIAASDIDLDINASQTVDKAFSIGKSDNIFINSFYAVKLMLTNEDVNYVIEYDSEKLNDILFDFGATINGVSTEHEYQFDENSITIIPGTAGQNRDTSVAEKEFIKAVSNGIYEGIELTLDYAEPEKLDAQKVYEELSKGPKNAEYVKNEDGKIIVTDDCVGVEVEKGALSAAISNVNSGKTVKIPASVNLPEKTKKDLEKKLFSATLGKYTTDFSTSTENRAFNVKRASDSMHETYLMPGEEFSYNDVIGNPSAENGYKMASVYENGKTTQGVGGGVCQVSSTLYSAVLYADLEVTERYNHSLTVAYVPKGQDATVSYGVLDFKFKNNTEYPVKVSSVIEGKKITVSIIGTEYSPKRKVELSHSLVSTIAPTENIKEDPTLPMGTKKVSEKGKNGYIVDTYKTVYENGVRVKSGKITRSTYRAIPAEVLIGPGTVLDENGVPVISQTPVESEQPTQTGDADVSAKPLEPSDSEKTDESYDNQEQTKPTQKPQRPQANLDSDNEDDTASETINKVDDE